MPIFVRRANAKGYYSLIWFISWILVLFGLMFDISLYFNNTVLFVLQNI